MYKIANSLESLKVVHGFFSKEGGVSKGIYESLNIGHGSDDIKADVDKNREIVKQILGINKLITLNQIHSDKVIVIDNSNINEAIKNPVKADGMVTKLPNVGLGVLSADCGCLLFIDEENQIIGSAHAGWKGALGGVIENVVKTMIQEGAVLSNIKIALGPCISVDSYEVQNDFYNKFISIDPINSEFFDQKGDSIYFNLSLFIKNICMTIGIKSFEMLNIDTYSCKNYYSYRRSCHNKETDYGRQVSVIAIGQKNNK